MLINNCSDRLLTDIVPNRVYLQGTGKIVSVVIFFFTNKVVARASHACRINAGSNKDYLFSSCFESIEICFRLYAHSSECCSFMASDYGDGKRHPLHPPGQGSEPAGTPTSPPSTTSSCLQPLHRSVMLKPQLQEQQPFTKPLVADKKMFWEQSFAPGSREIASPKGLFKFIRLNYVSLVGTDNSRRGSKNTSKDDYGASEK